MKQLTEKEIQNRILFKYGQRHDMRLWRANVGVAVPLEIVKKVRKLLAANERQQAIRTLDGVRAIRFNLNGQADLTGVTPDGRRLEIEVKSRNGVQSKHQKAFQQMIETTGGVYILARSVEDVDRALAFEMSVNKSSNAAANIVARAAIDYVSAANAFERQDEADAIEGGEDFAQVEEKLRRIVGEASPEIVRQIKGGGE